MSVSRVGDCRRLMNSLFYLSLRFSLNLNEEGCFAYTRSLGELNALEFRKCKVMEEQTKIVNIIYDLDKMRRVTMYRA